MVPIPGGLAPRQPKAVISPERRTEREELYTHTPDGSVSGAAHFGPWIPPDPPARTVWLSHCLIQMIMH